MFLRYKRIQSQYRREGWRRRYNEYMKDTQIQKLIKEQEVQIKKTINLIPSENFPSKDVLSALGSIFDYKYSEGYPGARYYGGNKVVDKLERLCQQRALKTFKLKDSEWHVNVQSLSGAPANLAIYTALVPKDGSIMGLALDHGGHLSHGYKVSVTGKWWRSIQYQLDKETEMLDYDAIEKLALKEKPTIIVAGYTAYSRIVNWKRFRDMANKAGALFLVDMSHISGLVAGGAYPSPFPYADIVMTTTHKTLRGPRGALIFVKKDGREMYKKIDRAVFPGLQGGPHNSLIAGIAVALKEAQAPAFKVYAKQVVKNTKVLALEFKKLGWRVVSGGTDSHLILVDTWMDGKGISGKVASDALEAKNIILNKNAIPFDTRPPMDPSGIRIGTPAETTRGWKEKDFVKLAHTIDNILKNIKKN